MSSGVLLLVLASCSWQLVEERWSLVLRWSEPTAGLHVLSAASFLKLEVGGDLGSCSGGGCPLLRRWHGASDEKEGAAAAVDRRLEAPALGYGVELVIDSFSVKPPRWRKLGGESATAFFNKCFCFQILCITPLLLAGLGGEGGKKRGAWLWERSGYPGGEEDASSECEILPVSGAPWRRSSTSGIKRRCSLLASHVCWWWRWFSSTELLRPAVVARGVAVWSLGVVGGWSGRCRVGGKRGGLGEQALWPYAFIELGLRRVAAGGSAVFYNVWRCSLPRQWWYGDSGGV